VHRITGRKASQLFDDFADPVRDIDEDVAVWRTDSPRTEVIAIISCPRTVRVGIELLAASIRTADRRPSQEAVAAALLDLGTELLWTVPAIQRLRDCRKCALVADDAEAQAWFATWSFAPLRIDEELPARLYTRVSRAGVQLRGLPGTLGLSTSTTGLLAVVAVLVQSAAVPDAGKRRLLALLRDFLKRVKVRAQRAEARVRDLVPDSRTVALSWSQILDEAEADDGNEP
jgi:hypothetical protein